MKSKLMTILAALLLAVGLVSGQTAIGTTTLSAAITASQTTFAVASATGITSQTAQSQVLLLIDRELMQVLTVSGTTVTVNRGRNGTAAAGHLSGATVYRGFPAAFTSNINRAEPSGSCTRGNLAYVPVIVFPSGNKYDCLGGQFVLTASGVGGAPGAVLGSAVASASTIAATGTMFHVTGTTAVNTITVPAGWQPGGCLVLIPDGLGGTGTSGNISLATTSVVNKALLECWDGTKWNPSY